MHLSKKNKWFFQNNGSLSWLSIWLLFSLVTIGNYIISYPSLASWDFLFFDTGASLKADYLISEGYQPAVDFGYPYGLIPLSIGHICYKIFGRTPYTFFLLVLILKIFSVAVLAKIAIQAKLKFLGIFFLALTIPFAFSNAQLYSLTHVIEPLLICLAISEHIAGRKRNVLFILIFGWFTKPSMSIVYIFFILILYFLDLLKRKTRFSKILFELLPSGIAFFSLSLIMKYAFSLSSMINTLVPLQSGKIYKQMNQGFFNEGKDFWMPHGAKITYYLSTLTGFWIILTLLLIVSVTYLYYKKINRKLDNKLNQLAEVQVTILYLHLSFIFFFYGIQSSWGYYSYLLTIGVSFLASQNFSELKSLRTALLAISIVFAIMGYKFSMINNISRWQISKPQESIVNLWSSQHEKEAFTKLLDSCKTQNTLVYSVGALDLFFPSCHMPGTFYPKNIDFLSNKEWLRISKQFDEAQQVVLVQSLGIGTTKNIEFKNKFTQFKIDHKDKLFTYFKRKN
jgi:hypothetical protein